jgi:ABC-type uncharacterized transport system ATPase subunit
MLAIVALLANAAVRTVPVYWNYFKFRDAVEETARFSSRRSEDEVRDRVMAIANRYEIPITAGDIQVAGHVPRRREAEFLKAITLVMGQKQQLIWDLPPAETFAMNRAIYEIPRATYEETLQELVTLLELGDLVEKPTRQLSLGERMKCELAAALLHRPRVLFLDEPTIGLDVSMQATVRSFVKTYNERYGATVLLTSHYMEDVVQLCPRVIVIDRGHVVYEGDLRALSREIRPDKRVVVRLANGAAGADLSPYGAVVSREGGLATLQVAADQVSATVARILTGNPSAGADEGLEWVRCTCRELEIPPLGAYGIGSERVAPLVENASKASSTKANPLPLTADELRQMLEQAL